MSGYLIVDGYNIINSWPDLKVLAEDNLEAARFKLIDRLSEFILLWDKITVVFDAHLVSGGVETKYIINNIEVIYSREGETADVVIEKITHNFKDNRNINILVATSDWIEQQVVFGRGARRISARELYDLLESLKESIRREYTENIFLFHRNPLDNHLKKNVKEKLDKWRRSK